MHTGILADTFSNNNVNIFIWKECRQQWTSVIKRPYVSNIIIIIIQ